MHLCQMHLTVLEPKIDMFTVAILVQVYGLAIRMLGRSRLACQALLQDSSPFLLKSFSLCEVTLTNYIALMAPISLLGAQWCLKLFYACGPSAWRCM